MSLSKEESIDHVKFAQNLALGLVYPESEFHNYSKHIEKLSELLDYLAEQDCLECIKNVKKEYTYVGDLIVLSIESGQLDQIRYKEYTRVLNHIEGYIHKLKSGLPDFNKLCFEIDIACDLLAVEILSKIESDEIKALLRPDQVVDHFINWKHEPWKLYYILLFFVDLELINFKGHKIPYYVKANFHINGQPIKISRFKESYNRSKMHKAGGKRDDLQRLLADVKANFDLYISQNRI